MKQGTATRAMWEAYTYTKQPPRARSGATPAALSSVINRGLIPASAVPGDVYGAARARLLDEEGNLVLDVDLHEDLDEDAYFRQHIAGEAAQSRHALERSVLQNGRSSAAPERKPERSFRYRPSAYHTDRKNTEARERAAAFPNYVPSKIDKFPGRSKSEKKEAAFAAPIDPEVTGDGSGFSHTPKASAFYMEKRTRGGGANASRRPAGVRGPGGLDDRPCSERCSEYGCGSCSLGDARVPSLTTLAIKAIAANIGAATRLPLVPARLLDDILRLSVIDKRILALALGAGATRVHLYDFWDFCNSFPAMWHCWQEGVSKEAPPPLERCMPTIECMMEVRDAVLQPSTCDWMRLFPLTHCMESLAVENQKDEDEESGPLIKLLIREAVACKTLRRVSIAFFDSINDSTISPLLTCTALTRLDLSHIPFLTDASMTAFTHKLKNLQELRLDFLAVTDSGFRDVGRLKHLHFLEIRACPYVQLQPPFNFQSLPKLRTFRLHPGAGSTDMTIVAQTLRSIVHCTRIKHLALGCKFAGGAGKGQGFDLRSASFKNLHHIELYNCNQMTWPSKFTLWTKSLRSIVLEEVTDSVIVRLKGLKTLTSLTICNAAGLAPGEFAAIGDLTSLCELVIGGLPPQLEPLVDELLKELPNLRTAHFHRCREYPTKASLF